jgi:hypothetical protein
MTEAVQDDGGVPGSPFLWRVVALGTAGAGIFLLTTGRATASVGIMLLVVALAAAGVLLGSAPYGPALEGRLDLSARLGLGLLGGALGGLTAVAMRWLLSAVGVAGLFGVQLAVDWSGPGFLAHLGTAALWGMVLGILYPHVPGRTAAGKGAAFSLVPSLYLLLKVYPFDMDLGWFGMELGGLTLVFVIGLNVLWGLVAGGAMGWGERADGPVSRPISE